MTINTQDIRRLQTIARNYAPLMSICIFHHIRTFDVTTVLSRNGEESFNKFLSPGPDRLRGGPSHGYTPFCVKIQVNLSSIFCVTYTDRHTDPNAVPLITLPPWSEGNYNYMKAKRKTNYNCVISV